MTLRSPTNRWATLGAVGEVVDTRLSELQEGVLQNRAGSVALLARLRQAAGKPAGSVPAVWQITLAGEFASRHSGDPATIAETAAHIAMTLYAVHQQSSGERMHRRGFGLGSSVRLLRAPEGDTDPVRRRFQALGTADSLAELVHHARGLVQQLRAAKIPLDYGLLSDELVRWRQPGGAALVRLQWGREFYRTPSKSDQANVLAPPTLQPAATPSA